MPPHDDARPAEAATRSSAIPLQAQLRSLWCDASTLARQELKLVRLELGEKAALLARGAGVLVAATALLVVGLVHISNAAQIWISARIHPALASLLLGGALVAAGATLVVIARRSFEPERLSLQRTLHSLQRERALAQEQRP